MDITFWTEYLKQIINRFDERERISDFFRFIISYFYLFPDERKNEKVFLSNDAFLNFLYSDDWKIKWLLQLFDFQISDNLIEFFTKEESLLIILYKLINNINFKDSTDCTQIYDILEDFDTKKESGSFYTPEIQVRILCQFALFYYLSNRKELKTYKKDIYEIIFQYKMPNSNSSEIYQKILNILQKIKILDPSCGTGIFLDTIIRLFIRIISINPLSQFMSAMELLNFVEKIISNCYAFDTNPRCITFTKVIIIRIWLEFNSKFPISAKIINDFTYSSLNIFLDDFLIQKLVPESYFDLIIGNPPFIRHHFILKKQFKIREFENDLKLALPQASLKIDKKADLYIYFWLRAISLCNQNGFTMFILSRSWLSSRFAITLKEVFSKYFQLDMILELPFELWKNAEIKTHIVIGHRINRENLNKEVRFFIWKDSTDKLLNLEITNFYPNYEYVSKINQNGIDLEISSIENEKYRLTEVSNILPILDKKKQIYPIFHLGYLLMPIVLLHQILIPKGDIFCRLKELGHLSMGSTTGANKFFYISKFIVDKYNFPPNYVYRMTKSPKEWKKILTKENENSILFLHIKEELNEQNNFNIRNYINKIEKKVKNRPFFKNKSPKNWYKIPLIRPDLLIPNMIYRRSFVAFNDGKYHIDKQWIGFWPKTQEWNYILLAFLNSSLGILLREVQGTRTLGLGSLKFSLKECEDLIVLDPRKLPKDIGKKLESLILKLGNLKISPIGEISNYSKIQQDIDKILIVDLMGYPPRIIKDLNDSLKFMIKLRFPNN